MQAYCCGDFPLPSVNQDLAKQTAIGIVKAAMYELNVRNEHIWSDLQCKKKPDVGVHVLCDFAPSKLVIFPMSRVVVARDPGSKVTGPVCLAKHDREEFIVKKDFTWPEKQRRTGTARTAGHQT